jgi:D-sedoheptulose 7-phosphate isomerase
MQSIERIFIESIEVKQKIVDDKLFLTKINQCVESIVLALKNGNKIFFAGNGGSAADAQHLTAEFTGRFYKERTPLAAICLNTNVSSITAIANDYGYSEVFVRQLTALAKKGDILAGITTSGNSENIIKAFKYAKENDILTIAFTGQKGGDLKDYADILLNVPSCDTPRIQESHITIGHIICELVEKKLF